MTDNPARDIVQNIQRGIESGIAKAKANRTATVELRLDQWLVVDASLEDSKVFGCYAALLEIRRQIQEQTR